MKCAQVVNDRGQSGGDSESGLKRTLPEKQVEYCLLLSPARLPIAVGHGELVEVGQQRASVPIIGLVKVHSRLSLRLRPPPFKCGLNRMSRERTPQWYGCPLVEENAPHRLRAFELTRASRFLPRKGLLCVWRWSTGGRTDR